MAPREYVPEVLLGTGGMAEVWRAQGPKGSVALKRLLPHAARDRSVAAAFEREGRLLAHIRHPNVVGLESLGRDDEGPFLALEYIEGCSLRALTGKPIAPRLALRVARDILSALETVHSLVGEDGRPLGLIHRDLSPANVLLSLGGAVKLADFGIARGQFGSHATTGHAVKGTLSYLSPEQAMGTALDRRSDLFGVGALLYEMLTGAPPYHDEDARLSLARARAGDVPSITTVRSDFDPAVVDLLDRALAPAPTDRFSDAARMRAEVDRVGTLVGGIATDAEIGDWVRTLPRDSIHAAVPAAGSRRRAKWRARGVVLGLSLLLLVVVLLVRRMHQDSAQAAASDPQPSADPLPTRSPEAPGENARVPPAEVIGTIGGSAPPSSTTSTTSSAAVTAMAPPSAAPTAMAPVGTTHRSGTSARPEGAAARDALLDIGSDPSFAYVSIDGSRAGSTPLFGYALAAGRHRIEVSREGLGQKSFSIDVHPGDHVSKIVKLP